VKYSKDLERLARSLAAQKLELSYIRHYLIDNYQVDNKTVDDIFAKLNLREPLKPGQKPPAKEAGGPAKPNRQGFF
jgi:hypothetical protein